MGGHGYDHNVKTRQKQKKKKNDFKEKTQSQRSLNGGKKDADSGKKRSLARLWWTRIGRERSCTLEPGGTSK